MAGPMTALATSMGHPSSGLISSWDASGTPLVVIVYKLFSFIFRF
ncbi:hypothetical protein [Clostridium estertheticum]|nr:hypothetical protein [Clostridium estertheticum]